MSALHAAVMSPENRQPPHLNIISASGMARYILKNIIFMVLYDMIDFQYFPIIFVSFLLYINSINIHLSLSAGGSASFPLILEWIIYF